MRYARHFARVFNTPLLVEQAWAATALPALNIALRNGQFSDEQAFVTAARTRSEQSGLRMEGSVAVVPVLGPLLHRGAYDAECTYLTGYQDIANMVRAAGADSACRAIVLSIDSPGGEVAGCFDLAENIQEYANGKPIYAAINDMGCSAAYALAAASKEIHVTQNAVVGSVGVYVCHMDFSRLMDMSGVKPTYIFAGRRKVDGNPLEPLGEEAKAMIQADVDALYQKFAGFVARSRGMEPEAVIATEAAVFRGQDAVSIGLADNVVTPDKLISRLAEGFSEAGAISTVFSSRADSQAGATAMPIPEAIAAVLGLSADSTEDQAVETIKGLSVSAADHAAAAERERIIGIMTSEEAEGRMDTAIRLAKVPTMTPESAAEVLSTVERKATANNSFAEAMSRMNVDVGANPEVEDRRENFQSYWEAGFSSSKPN
jgi:signal peptide peptidase SppA